MFDRSTGLAAGLVVGVLQAAIVVMVLLAVGDATANGPAQKLPAQHTDSASAVRNSLFGSHIAGLDPALKTFFGPALPNSLSGYLADTTATPIASR